MIFPQTILKISDNSGGKYFKCIQILKKGSRTRDGRIGDLIVGSIKKLRSKNRILSKVKKGDVVVGVVVKTKTPIMRSVGVKLKFYENSVVLITKSITPIATRVLGVLPKELRKDKFMKIISISNGIT